MSNNKMTAYTVAQAFAWGLILLGMLYLIFGLFTGCTTNNTYQITPRIDTPRRAAQPIELLTAPPRTNRN